MASNRQIVLAERPRYVIPTSRCFRLQDAPEPEVGDKGIVVETQWLGMEPYLLGKVKRAQGPAPIGLGEPMEGPGVGRVTASTDPRFAEGDLVTGMWQWADRARTTAHYVRKVPDSLQQKSHALGALGYTGFGAWLSVGELGAAQAGETVVVGAATGGLGQMIGQMAKIRGYRAVGLAGGGAKCEVATRDLGFDHCIDRHGNRHLEGQLREACQQGVDVYVDVVGGRLFHTVWQMLNRKARVVVAGLMSVYAMQGRPEAIDHSMSMLSDINTKRISVVGMVVFDHMSTLYSSFKQEMLGWLGSGQVKPLEHISNGLESAPEALQSVFEGRKLGKSVVQVMA